MWRKSSGFRVSPLTLRSAPFRVSCVGKPKPSGAHPEPPGTGPRPAAGSEPGVTGRPEADRHGGRGTDRGAPGHAGTGAWRGLSDTTCDGWSLTTSTWPRGAGAASAARLLGAASRSPSGGAGTALQQSVAAVGPADGRRLHGARVDIYIDAGLALELEGAVGDPERHGDGELDPVSDHSGLLQRGVTGQLQMGGEQPDLARQAPDMEVVDATHPGNPDHGRGQAVEVDVGGSGLEEHGDARAEDAGGLDHDDGGDHHRRDRIEPRGRCLLYTSPSPRDRQK